MIDVHKHCYIASMCFMSKLSNMMADIMLPRDRWLLGTGSYPYKCPDYPNAQWSMQYTRLSMKQPKRMNETRVYKWRPREQMALLIIVLLSFSSSTAFNIVRTCFCMHWQYMLSCSLVYWLLHKSEPMQQALHKHGLLPWTGPKEVMLHTICHKIGMFPAQTFMDIRMYHLQMILKVGTIVLKCFRSSTRLEPMVPWA